MHNLRDIFFKFDRYTGHEIFPLTGALLNVDFDNEHMVVIGILAWSFSIIIVLKIGGTFLSAIYIGTSVDVNTLE